MIGEKGSKPWFRLQHAIKAHPKFWAIPDALVRDWLILLCCACEEDNSGRLPPPAELAFWMRRVIGKEGNYRSDIASGTLPDRSGQSAISVIEELIELGMIEKRNGGPQGWAYVIHNWDKWQYKSDSSKERTQEWRAKNKGRHNAVTEAVTETPHASGRVRAESEQKKENSKERSNDENLDPIDPETGQLIDPKTGKPVTVQKWHERLLMVREHQAWPAKWRARPGEEGCLMPASAGLTEDDKRAGPGWRDWDEYMASRGLK